MILYDAAENSLEIDRMIIDALDAFKTAEEARSFANEGENVYEIEINVRELKK